MLWCITMVYAVFNFIITHHVVFTMMLMNVWTLPYAVIFHHVAWYCVELCCLMPCCVICTSCCFVLFPTFRLKKMMKVTQWPTALWKGPPLHPEPPLNPAASMLPSGNQTQQRFQFSYRWFHFQSLSLIFAHYTLVTDMYVSY